MTVTTATTTTTATTPVPVAMKFYTIDEIPDVFADVEPVPVLVDDEGVAVIAYSTAFQVAFGYWRALRDERSERVLHLTATCLKINPANYTVWHHRRLCLNAVYNPAASATGCLKGPADQGDNISSVARLFAYVPADLQLAASLGGDNPKNYQIWYHRRALLEMVLQFSHNNNNETSATNNDNDFVTQLITAELDYISAVLREDGKNYHAWTHRQWCVNGIAAHNSNNITASAELWEKEFVLAQQWIQRDRRNNSAWNHRWFVTHRGQVQHRALSVEDAHAELMYVVHSPDVALVGDPNNESPWRYYVAVVKEQIYALQDGATVMRLLCRAREDIVGVRNQIAALEKAPNATAALIDVLEWQGEADAIRQAMDLCHVLANEHDVIRRKYWNFRAQQLQTALNKVVGSE